MRWMVALRVKRGRERQHMRGTKLHAETAGFTALDNNRNTSFCHGISTLGVVERSPETCVIIASRRRGWM
jgi:hypothetical protein